MTFVKSFFSLMKEDSKQKAWVIALHILSLFFILPIFAILILGNEVNHTSVQMTAEEVLQLRRSFLGIVSGFNSFIQWEMPVAAIVTGISEFAYLFSRQKTDFYHSMPVKREKWFFVNYLNGLFMFVIPYVIFTLLAFFVCGNMYKVSNYGNLLGTVVMDMVGNIIIYWAYYSVAVVAVMMVGHVVLAVLATGVFLSYNFMITFLINGLSSRFFNHFVNQGSYNGVFLPVFWQAQLATLMSDSKPIFGILFMKLLATAVIGMVIALILYHFRKSEAAGNAIAFAPTKPVIRFLITVPVGLASGLLLEEMAGSGKEVWFIFGLLVGSALTHAILQVIMEFDFKAAFKGRRCLFLSVCATFFIACVYWFDLTGYDAWVPQESKVQSAAICFNNFVYYDDTDDTALKNMKLEGEDVKKLINLVNEIKDINDGGNYISLEYRMKSGKKIKRQYYFHLTDSVKQKVIELCNTTTYKESVYPILTEYKNPEIAYIYRLDIVMPNDSVDEVGLNKDQFEQLLATYCKELNAMDAKIRFTEKMVTKIGFLNKNNTEDDEITKYYPVYESFNETIQLLNLFGIDYRWDTKVNDIEKIKVSNTENYDKNVIYTDKEKMKQILNNSTVNGGYVYDEIDRELWSTDDNYEVMIYWKDGNQDQATFYKKCVPGFIENDIK